jgi:hypothetical protein
MLQRPSFLGNSLYNDDLKRLEAGMMATSLD